MSRECVRVKRAVEAALQYHGLQDLARVTRSVYSHIHGTHVVDVELMGRTYHRRLEGPRDAHAVTEGVMQEHAGIYPGEIPTREP